MAQRRGAGGYFGTSREVVSPTMSRRCSLRPLMLVVRARRTRVRWTDPRSAPSDCEIAHPGGRGGSGFSVRSPVAGVSSGRCVTALARKGCARILGRPRRKAATPHGYAWWSWRTVFRRGWREKPAVEGQRSVVGSRRRLTAKQRSCRIRKIARPCERAQSLRRKHSGPRRIKRRGPE